MNPVANETSETRETLKIRPFEKKDAPDFKRMNMDWLEGYGLLEDADMWYLNTPFDAIIHPGGQIFVAVDAGVVVGTCAAIRHGRGFEIAKLAVRQSHRQRGIGRMLAKTCIAYARGQGGDRVFLVSNSRLTSAMALYASMGFEFAAVPGHVAYETADVYMELRR